MLLVSFSKSKKGEMETFDLLVDLFI